MRRDQAHLDQPSLFDDVVKAAVTTTPRQEQELQRVKSRIAGHIRDFLKGRTKFHAAELHQWVQERAAVAPASCDRILREMRKVGELDYKVLNRRQSLYKLEWIK